MAKREYVSISVVRRLPRYYRFLNDLLKNGFSRISSRELSARMGLTASQIRQDLNCFGGFGQQGYGYNVEQLRDSIGSILGIDRKFPIVIVGVGNIGRALAVNMNFDAFGFQLCGIFDVSPAVVGKRIAGLEVLHIDEIERFCGVSSPKTAVLTIPTAAAPDIVRRLVGCGVRSFWNYTHYDVARSYKDVVVENVHLSDNLMTLCYRIKYADEKPPEPTANDEA